MSEKEKLHLILKERISDLVRGIVYAQALRAELQGEIDVREWEPFEDDYIMERQYGEAPIEARTKRLAGVEIQTRVLHRRGVGMRDIKGADLLYEIEDHKYLILQLKKEANGRVQNDKDQFKSLIDSCPRERASFPDYNWPISVPDTACGSWYGVVKGNESFHFPACIAARVFEGADTTKVEKFCDGISEKSFEELFAKCWIGSQLKMHVHGVLSFTNYSQNLDHLLFTVLQKGRW